MKTIHSNKLLKYDGDRFITEIYRSVLDRNPDPKGFSYFKNLLASGSSKEFILYSIVMSEEAQKKQPEIIGFEEIQKKFLNKNGKKKKNSWFYSFLDLPRKVNSLYEEIKRQGLLIEKINDQKGSIIPAADNIVLANIQGFIMGLPAEDLSVLAQMIYYNGLEPGLETAFKKSVKKGMTIVDIGAHVGLYTLLAARIIGNEGKIYSFEPFPRTFNLLKQNININFFISSDKIFCEQIAVTDKKGRAKFFIFPQKTGHNSLYSSGSKSSPISVKTTSLDKYFKPLEKIDVIKIDAEGSEPMIIKGMKNIIKNNPRITIFMEFCPKNLLLAGINPADFLKYLRKLDLKIKLIDDFTGEARNISELKLINCFSENLLLTKN